MNYKQMLEKFQELEARIAFLERAVKDSTDFFKAGPAKRPDPFVVPVVPQDDPWKLTPPQKWNNVCQVCGMDLSGTMGYVCSNLQCPRAVTCNNPQDGFK